MGTGVVLTSNLPCIHLHVPPTPHVGDILDFIATLPPQQQVEAHAEIAAIEADALQNMQVRTAGCMSQRTSLCPWRPCPF